MSVSEAILLTPSGDAHPLACVSSRDVKRRARHWNVWWTLSMVFMALSILVAVLELLGMLGDLGVVLAVIGVGLSMMSGLTAASRSSVDQIGEAIVTLVAEVSGSREDIRTLGTGFERIERELMGLDRIERQLLGLERIEHELLGLERIERALLGLERIERVLVDRLPPR